MIEHLDQLLGTLGGTRPLPTPKRARDTDDRQEEEDETPRWKRRCVVKATAILVDPRQGPKLFLEACLPGRPDTASNDKPRTPGRLRVGWKPKKRNRSTFLRDFGRWLKRKNPRTKPTTATQVPDLGTFKTSISEPEAVDSTGSGHGSHGAGDTSQPEVPQLIVTQPTPEVPQLIITQPSPESSQLEINEPGPGCNATLTVPAEEGEVEGEGVGEGEAEAEAEDEAELEGEGEGGGEDNDSSEPLEIDESGSDSDGESWSLSEEEETDEDEEEEDEDEEEEEEEEEKEEEEEENGEGEGEGEEGGEDDNQPDALEHVEIPSDSDSSSSSEGEGEDEEGPSDIFAAPEYSRADVKSAAKGLKKLTKLLKKNPNPDTAAQTELLTALGELHWMLREVPYSDLPLARSFRQAVYNHPKASQWPDPDAIMYLQRTLQAMREFQQRAHSVPQKVRNYYAV